MNPIPGKACRNALKKNTFRRRSKRDLAIRDNFLSVFPFSKLITILTLSSWLGMLSITHYQLDELTGRRNQVSGRQRLLFAEASTENLLDLSQQQILERFDDQRFLIFEGDRLAGQGAGNLMNGLLATHLFGDEFNRTVCIVPGYKFPFERKDPLKRVLCKLFFEKHPEIPVQMENRIFVVNFMKPPDECELQQALASEDKKVLYIQANTYPRWRSVPSEYFFNFYRPTREFLQSLPYSADQHIPSTVVHLRMEDGRSDPRQGLDPLSLDTLGALLSKDASSSTDRPYLVTNHVAWFDFFGTKYGFDHPEYEIVTHSATRAKWGDRKESRKGFGQYPETKQAKELQILQLWRDWLALLLAKKVYHTHSDFSLSAIHWMGSDEPDQQGDITWSRTIMGVSSNKELILERESWVTEPTMKRLVDRHGEELANCQTMANSWKTNNRMQLDTSSSSTQDFIQRSLDVNAERMQEYRQRLKGRDYTFEEQLSSTEVARHVSETLARHRGSGQ